MYFKVFGQKLALRVFQVSLTVFALAVLLSPLPESAASAIATLRSDAAAISPAAIFQLQSAARVWVAVRESKCTALRMGVAKWKESTDGSMIGTLKKCRALALAVLQVPEHTHRYAANLLVNFRTILFF